MHSDLGIRSDCHGLKSARQVFHSLDDTEGRNKFFKVIKCKKFYSFKKLVHCSLTGSFPRPPTLCVCVCVCVRACARVRACVRVCVTGISILNITVSYFLSCGQPNDDHMLLCLYVVAFNFPVYL